MNILQSSDSQVAQMALDYESKRDLRNIDGLKKSVKIFINSIWFLVHE